MDGQQNMGSTFEASRAGTSAKEGGEEDEEDEEDYDTDEQTLRTIPMSYTYLFVMRYVQFIYIWEQIYSG